MTETLVKDEVKVMLPSISKVFPCKIRLGKVFDFGGVLTITELKINGESWFIAMDIAKGLQYYNTTNMIKHIDNRDWTKIKPSILEGLGCKVRSKNDIVIINESGMWDSILNSTKPEAKEFRHWVTSVLLPTLRKQGYIDIRNSYDEKIHQKDEEIASLKKELEEKEALCHEIIIERNGFVEDCNNLITVVGRTAPVGTEEEIKTKKPRRGALVKEPRSRLDSYYKSEILKGIRTHVIGDDIFEKVKSCYEASLVKGGAKLYKIEKQLIELSNAGKIAIQTTFDFNV